MIKSIKKTLYHLCYLAYKYKIVKNMLSVKSVDETIDTLLHTQKSFVRFGDAEISIIEGRTTQFQNYNEELGTRLYEILQCKEENILVGIPDIFDSLDEYTKLSRPFWKEHLFFSRKTYEKYCRSDITYENAFFSRLCYIFEDKKQAAIRFSRTREIWKDKDVVVVEGEATHTGVNNDLLDTARSVERILCPSFNAFSAYEEIKRACMELDKDKLFLLAVGNTAKLLVSDLDKNGYRAIDIGNLDMEYEWLLCGTKTKIPVSKHKIIGREANINAGFYSYLEQVRTIIS